MVVDLISVIVPIFNKEDYLNKSIRSLIDQKYSNIEIILVNDGSTDNSLSICREYEKKDKRIKVIDKSNGGVSSARNIGLEEATGDYIGFIDPDDWISTNMYYSMHNRAIEKNADVVMCDYWIEKKEDKIKKIIDTKKEKLEGEEITNILVADMINYDTLDVGTSALMGSVCRMLIKREIIFENNITFDVDIPYMEDLLFAIEVLINAKVTVIDKVAHYHYNQIENSASNQYYPNFLENHMNVFEKIKNILIKYGSTDILKERLKLRYIFIILHSIANEVKKDNNKKNAQKIKSINIIIKDKTVKKYVKDLNYKEYSSKRKLVLYSLENEYTIILFYYYFLTNRLHNNKFIQRYL